MAGSSRTRSDVRARRVKRHDRRTGLVRLELSDGTVRWDRMLPGMLRSPVAAHGRVFVGSTSNAFYAVDQDSGGVAWSYKVGGDVVGAAVDRDVVYVAALDNVLRA